MTKNSFPSKVVDVARHRKELRKSNRGHYKKSFVPYPFSRFEEVVIEIDGLSNLGHGVGRVDHTPETGEPVSNWVVFVPFALPLERVRAKITHNAKKHSIGEIVEILEPSPDRVEPKCSHFYHCGGCQFQHLSYPQQLIYQTAEIREQLLKLAQIEHPVQPAISGSQIWHYRSKITPHYKKPEKGKIAALGFLHHSNKNQLVDLRSCAIAMPQLNQSLAPAKKNLQGRSRQIKQDGTLLLRAHGESVETHSANVISEKVGPLEFHFLAGDFFQNNPYILEPFTEYVTQQAKTAGSRFLVDAYCGCGLFSLTSAKQFEAVAGVEVSATSADWARYNAEFNNIDNATFIAAKAEKIFKQIDFIPSATTVVIDPPRAGCSIDFLQQLVDFKPARVVYVSCEPATQMRDLKQFCENGYTIKEVQPFDLFPHTRHLECVVTLDLTEID